MTITGMPAEVVCEELKGPEACILTSSQPYFNQKTFLNLDYHFCG